MIINCLRRWGSCRRGLGLRRERGSGGEVEVSALQDGDAHDLATRAAG